MCPLGRIPGVVPELPYDDEERYFGREVAPLLRRRRHLQRLVEDVRSANPALMPYEHSVYEQRRKEIQTDLRYLEFALVDEHALTLPPHVVPYTDMQRADVLEGWAREIDELERGASPVRNFLDFLAFSLWWPLTVWPRPPASRKGSRIAPALLDYVDSRADDVKSRYSSYSDMVEDLSMQREYMELVRDREIPSRIAQPYEWFLHEVVRLECLLEYRLLEYAVVRPFASPKTGLSNTPDGVALTGMEAEILDLMVRVEHGSWTRFLMNCLLFAPWWALRTVAWSLSRFRRKTA